ncbi:MAG: helix-turn-helix transcriptional regulator [Clostridia bacterium]|nr:helix-turn-helix transcriptional regulator [Clostridia bacterium]
MNNTIRLKQIRKQNHMTQNQVAEAVGLSTRHYQKLENLQSDIKLSQIVKFCKFFNVSIAYFLGETDEFTTYY